MSDLKIGSLFSGYGGLDMAVEAVTGARTAWVSDIDKGACKILAHRYPDIPNLGDLTQVDWSTVEPVDIITGGFPCQDLSHAGKRAGMGEDTRSGLWSYMCDAINIIRPRLVVAENVRGLLSAEALRDVEPCAWCVGDEPVFDVRALGAVLSDLAAIRYDALWTSNTASSVGACHPRLRVFLIAIAQDTAGIGEPTRSSTPVRRHERGAALRSVGSSLGITANADGIPVGLGSRSSRSDQGEERREGPTDDGADRSRTSSPCGEAAPSSLDEWGIYAPAIARWERVTGRRAPTGLIWDADDEPTLNPAFTEWMMGLPAGWITDTPDLTRNEALKACGNGVVPQQAAAALRVLLTATERAA